MQAARRACELVQQPLPRPPYRRRRPAGSGPARAGGRRRLPQAEAEVRRRVGAAAFAGARAGPRLCTVLHASGARPAPEQQQPRASPQRRQHHQRQPPEPPPQRGRRAPGVAATASRRHLPGLDRSELLRGDEPQRALDAGAVLAQALLEPRQAQSLQPDLCSALRLRHGELGRPTLPPLLSWTLPPAAPTGPAGSRPGGPCGLGVRGRSGRKVSWTLKGARGTGSEERWATSDIWYGRLGVRQMSRVGGLRCLQMGNFDAASGEKQQDL